jgi:hypothetical protein
MEASGSLYFELVQDYLERVKFEGLVVNFENF